MPSLKHFGLPTVPFFWGASDKGLGIFAEAFNLIDRKFLVPCQHRCERLLGMLTQN
jgi:hypothetical protein